MDMLSIAHIVIDPKVADALLYLFSVVATLALIYLIRIHIAYKMAKNRHRDPLGWVLLSLFVSALLTWIILLIAGDAKK